MRDIALVTEKECKRFYCTVIIHFIHISVWKWSMYTRTCSTVPVFLCPVFNDFYSQLDDDLLFSDYFPCLIIITAAGIFFRCRNLMAFCRYMLFSSSAVSASFSISDVFFCSWLRSFFSSFSTSSITSIQCLRTVAVSMWGYLAWV